MFYYYGYNDSHSISGGKRTIHQNLLKRSIKRYKNLLDRKLGWNNWVQSVIGFNVLSLIHCSGSWSASTRNIIKNFSYHNHARWWLRLFFKLWNRTHGGGVIVEFLKLFYISSQMLDKRYVYPQEFPGVQYRTATQLFTASLPRSGNLI